jgi:hypothetical protein
MILSNASLILNPFQSGHELLDCFLLLGPPTPDSARCLPPIPVRSGRLPPEFGSGYPAGMDWIIQFDKDQKLSGTPAGMSAAFLQQGFFDGL